MNPWTEVSKLAGYAASVTPVLLTAALQLHADRVGGGEERFASLSCRQVAVFVSRVSNHVPLPNRVYNSLGTELG